MPILAYVSIKIEENSKDEIHVEPVGQDVKKRSKED